MRDILQNDNAFATPLLLYVVDNLGMDAFTYESDTIADFLRSRNPRIKAPLIERTNAALGLFSSNLFWQEPTVFGLICRTLNRNPKPALKEPDIMDVAWGMTEVKLIMKDTEADAADEDKYSQAIDAYAGYLLKLNGIYDTPKSMSGIHPPRGTTRTLDDSAQLLSIQERSDAARDVLDYNIFQQMAELLRQVRDTNLSMTKQASAELNELLQSMQVFDNGDNSAT